MEENNKGLFISFEGVDGCGKSTQIRFLSEHLDELKIDYIITREPGGSPIAESIRDILLDVNNTNMNARTEALLYAAARVQHIDDVIMPALTAGKVVLCDRYIDSSVAYQAFGRDLGVDVITAINSYAYAHCMPDITIFLDYNPKASFDRMHKRKSMDRLELEGDEFFDKVYRGFDFVAKENPARVRRIDVSGTKFETKDKLAALMDDILHERKMI